METACFERFYIELNYDDAASASHPGPCDDEVATLLEIPYIQEQLDNIPDDTLVNELREYGAWDASELADRSANNARIIWLAAGNILEAV
jgi:hypothetical protein